MGDNPKTSVLNKWNQSHDIKNLFRGRWRRLRDVRMAELVADDSFSRHAGVRVPCGTDEAEGLVTAAVQPLLRAAALFRLLEPRPSGAVPRESAPSPMRQLGVIAVPSTNPTLTHGAELPTNHLVAALELDAIFFRVDRRGVYPGDLFHVVKILEGAVFVPILNDGFGLGGGDL